MKTKGVRMHGKDDVRFEEFDLPDMTENDIVCKVSLVGIPLGVPSFDNAGTKTVWINLLSHLIYLLTLSPCQE